MAHPLSVFNTYPTDPNAGARDSVNVSGTTTYYSRIWSGEDSDGQSMSVFYTGTPTGTFSLWHTNKPGPDESNDNDWIQDTNFAPTNPAGAAGKFGDDAGNSKAYRKRLKYVNASGTGTIQAYVAVTKTH